MASGSYYVPVEADVVMPMAEGNSGGYYVKGYEVNWNEKGIIGKNWEEVIDLPNSPFAGVLKEDLEDIAATPGGNLNSYFLNWAATYDSEKELEFLLAAARTYPGCVGDA